MSAPVKTDKPIYTLKAKQADLVFISDTTHIGNGNGLANTMTGAGGNDTLYGMGGTDTLYGGIGNDRLYGGTGVDTLYGGNGADLLYGGKGADVLSGGNGNDRLFGGFGNDTLDGGSGRNVLYGGAGADKFVFSAAPGNGNFNTIADFRHADGDHIVLDSKVFAALTAGTLPDADFASGRGVTSAKTADQHVLYDTHTGYLYYDADGAGGNAAVKIGQIGTALHPDLTAGDFVIV